MAGYEFCTPPMYTSILAIKSEAWGHLALTCPVAPAAAVVRTSMCTRKVRKSSTAASGRLIVTMDDGPAVVAPVVSIL